MLSAAAGLRPDGRAGVPVPHNLSPHNPRLHKTLLLGPNFRGAFRALRTAGRGLLPEILTERWPQAGRCRTWRR